MISKKAIIEKLAQLPGRGAGSLSERLASESVDYDLTSMGYSPKVESFRAQASMPLIHLIHFLPLFLISTIINHFPLVGSILGLLVLLSFWGEFTYRFFILRRLLPKKESQNVVARLGNPEAKTKVILSAHVDAAKTGLFFHPAVARFVGSFEKQPLHKTNLTLMLLLILIFIIKAFGGGTWVLSVVFNFIAVLTLLGSLIILQWEASPYTKGTNDDLSGVAVVLGLAEELKNNPHDDIEFYFIITGSEESHCNGMKAFINAHAKEFSKQSTYFINVECVGGGRLKYVTEEGFIIFQRHDHTLIQIFESAAKKYNLDLTPGVTVAHCDSIVPRVLGYKSINLIALDDHNIPTNYHRISDTEENIDYALLDHAQDALLKVIGLIKEFKELGFI